MGGPPPGDRSPPGSDLRPLHGQAGCSLLGVAAFVNSQFLQRRQDELELTPVCFPSFRDHSASGSAGTGLLLDVRKQILCVLSSFHSCFLWES